jgi:DNA modification methylase
MKLILDDCLEAMKTIQDGSIDLTVTSPPYDNLRSYNGNSQFNFNRVANQLYRITKPGGGVVWVVGDATIDGSETGTSFRQALYFKEIGFNLHDTMIYQFAGTGAKGSNYCYWQAFEYMFIFSKGKPAIINRLKDHANIRCGGRQGHVGKYANGTRKERGIRTVPEYSVRPNVWIYGGSVGDKTSHPAQFPEELARDHILSWSKSGGVVMDCFMGSGTTGKMAVLNGRDFIGIEIDPGYFKIAERRIKDAQAQIQLDFKEGA